MRKDFFVGGNTEIHLALVFGILTNLEYFCDGELSSFAQETKFAGFWEEEIENLLSP